MHDIKDGHRDEHQESIKNIYVDLVVQEVSVISLKIFSQSKNGANHDQEARQIKHMQMFAPGDVWSAGAWDWVFLNLPVKVACCDDEEPEKKDLNKEADNDDVLAVLHVLHISTALNATT
jgi:hypothetical protein